MSDLILHCGSRQVDRSSLALVPTPRATDTWHPIPHAAVIDTVHQAMADSGFAIERQSYGLSRDDRRMFATWDLMSPLIEGVSLAVGIRNSHDKSFPMGFAAGSRVFVCDNLSFSSELMVKHKHTRFGHTRFEDNLRLAVSGLESFRQLESVRFQRLQNDPVDDTLAESLLLRAWEAKVISHMVLAEALRLWREPTHEEFLDRTRWSLLNALTEAMNPTHDVAPERHARATMALRAMLCPPIN